MFAAGWYPDPEDSSNQRYYDGQNWTEHRRSSAGPAAAPTPQAPQGWGGAGGQASQATPAPQGWGGAGGQASQATPTAATPTPQGWGGGQTQQAPLSAAPWGGQGGQGGPAQQPWQSAPTPSWQQPHTGIGYPPPYQAAARSRGNRPLIIGLVVVLLAGLLTGGYFLFLRGDAAPTLTYQGSKIKDASGVLKQAETNLQAIITRRHGAKGADTRCYYAVPNTPPSGAKKSDVDSNLRCGPVLFVDGDAAKQYLIFPLTKSGSGGTVTLTPASSPRSTEPSSAVDVKLKRPDSKNAPSGDGGLKVPEPPPADANALLAADLGHSTVQDAPSSSVMGSSSGGVTLTKLGPVTRYGSGETARSAPPGQKLIAFTTAGAKGELGITSNLSSSSGVSVDGGTARPLPDASGGQYIVVAVPTAAKSVDLVLDDHGLKQAISLLDGRPGSNNILVLARKNRQMVQTQTTNAVFSFTPAVVFSDNTTGAAEGATVTFKLAELNYRNTDETPITASSPRKAIMHVSMTYVAVHDRGTFGFPAGLLTFTPAGGTPVHARNIASSANKIYNIFEVPGNMTGGTLTLSGSVSQTFGNSRGSYRLGIQTPVSIPISIPLG